MYKKSKKKGQSAIEYLITYGWAFLMITTVVAMLLLSGFLDFLIYRENQAVGFSTVKVMQFDVFSDNRIILVISNDADVGIEVQDIKFNHGTIGSVSFPFEMQPGEQVVVSGDINYTSYKGEYFKAVPLEFTYYVIGGTRDHIDSGTISGRAS